MMNSNQYYDRYQRNQEARAFYRSKAWLDCRAIVLLRDNYLCQDCFKNKQLIPADMVHHLKELEDSPDLALDIDNLVSLCNPCHNTRHSKKVKRVEAIRKKIKVVKTPKNPEVI